MKRHSRGQLDEHHSKPFRKARIIKTGFKCVNMSPEIKPRSGQILIINSNMLKDTEEQNLTSITQNLSEKLGSSKYPNIRPIRLLNKWSENNVIHCNINIYPSQQQEKPKWLSWIYT